jgi:agmatinase
MRRKYTKDMTGVDLAVTGVPLDTATTNRPGSRFGPRAIRAASTIMAWEKPYGMTVDPFDKLAVVDCGDCFFDHGRPENVPAEIEEHAFGIIDQGPGLLTLGGDHFIAYPLLKAHVRKHGGPLSLLHFDAHSDTWEDTNNRIDHGTMFWWAVKEGLVDPGASMQIGLRTTNRDTLGFNIMVCGGLTSHQAMSILRGLKGINVIGMDVVEVAPAYDIGEITALAAVHVAMEMLYLYASRPVS